MARLFWSRVRPWRFLSIRTIVTAVPMVWIIIILWTLYSAQSVQQRQSRRSLSFNDLNPTDLESNHVKVLDGIQPALFQPVIDKSDIDLIDVEVPIAPVVQPNMATHDDTTNEWEDTDKRENEKSVSIQKINNSFAEAKHQPSDLFVQPESREWDVPNDKDHFEFVWNKAQPKPDRHFIYPGFRVDPPKLGEYGLPVQIQIDNLNNSEYAKYMKGWSNYQYNEYTSLQISTQREVPDFRPDKCKNKMHTVDVLKASIIICFYNEAWSVLLRTIHSVFNRSPPELITEVILVDDFSDMVTMHESLEYYVAQVEKLRLIRMTKRSGLVKARLAGVQEATGPVLIFLDSHVECAKGWLEPLLQTIQDHPNIAVTPEIDVIDHKDFSIQAAVNNIGILEFKTFTFNWAAIMPRILQKITSASDPFESPTMAGGLFAIRKDYFISLGTYDPGLELWGGENIELSLKLWMCGGGILIHPCSRVSHIFRDRSPYLKGKSANVLVKNSARVAEVWSDQYHRFYFQDDEGPYDRETYGDVEKQKQLRSQLQCKDFEWYLNNVYPEMYIEGTGRNLGKINSKGGLCIHNIKPDAPLVLMECSRANVWETTRINEIRIQTFCLDRPAEIAQLVSTRCDLQSKTQVFAYLPNKAIYHPLSDSCLTAVGYGAPITFQNCHGKDSQIWIWPENPNHILQLEGHR